MWTIFSDGLLRCPGTDAPRPLSLAVAFGRIAAIGWGASDPERTLDAIRAAVRVFLDVRLRGGDGTGLRRLPALYPDLRFIARATLQQWGAREKSPLEAATLSSVEGNERPMAFDIEGTLAGLAQTRQWLAGTVAKTPGDRMNWRPPSDGGDPTTIAELLKHLVSSDGQLCAMLTGEPPKAPEGEGGEYFASSSFGASGPAAGVQTKDGLLKAVEKRGAATDAALRSIPAEQWGAVVDTGWHKGSKAEFATILVTHWHYHLGQIAYIQRLYGDLAFGE